MAKDKGKGGKGGGKARGGGQAAAKKAPANGGKTKRQLQQATRSSPRDHKKSKRAEEDEASYQDPSDADVRDSDTDLQDAEPDVQDAETLRLQKQLLEEQIKHQRLVNQMALSSQIQQHQVKSGRKSSANAFQFSSYNPQTMTQKQKAISKSFKKFTWRLYKFMSQKTLKKVATAAAIHFKPVEFHLTGDKVVDAGKYFGTFVLFLEPILVNS